MRKSNIFKEFTKKRTFRYFSGRILIKSEIKLTKNQRTEIFDIVRKSLEKIYYGFERQIPREIFHKLEGNVHSVEFYTTRLGFLVKIKSSVTN